MLRARLATFVLLGGVLAMPAVASAQAPTPTPTPPPAATPVPTPVPTPVATPAPTIRAGVTVAGVDVSGLTDAQAQTRIEQQLVPILRQDVVLNVAGHRYHFPVVKAKLTLLGRKTA